MTIFAFIQPIFNLLLCSLVLGLVFDLFLVGKMADVESMDVEDITLNTNEAEEIIPKSPEE